ncbi:MAG: N-acetylmuramidase family protein [Moraxellaceae bacterium]|nr:N-acetylmuramidase family protein [Moraxellaceae bacterium]
MSVLRNGDTGEAVRRLQRQLVALGCVLAVDGWFGEATETAVRELQARFGLVVDGAAGPKTLAALETGKPQPRLLGEADLIAAAETLGVPLASVKAVNAVESRGTGFLDDGRPVILFERHVMHRRLAAAGHDADALAARFPNLVNPKRGGYVGGAEEHMRVAAAMQIDRGCALEAASWGLFQIMGFNHEACGYTIVEDFADDMRTSEGKQLEAFVQFVIADPALHKALKARKWADFARLYNGLAYRDNLYDVKLQRAYERFSTSPAEVAAEVPA